MHFFSVVGLVFYTLTLQVGLLPRHSVFTFYFLPDSILSFSNVYLIVSKLVITDFKCHSFEIGNHLFFHFYIFFVEILEGDN